MMAILLQLLVEMAQEVFFLNRETEIHKSERINKFTVDISLILGNLITVIVDYQIPHKPLKILSL